MSTPTSTPPCALVPINLSHADEVEELRQHRVVCGWHSEPEVMALWREKQEKNLKSFFWITIPDSSSSETTEKTIRAGHISLDSYCDPPDADLACADKTNMTIQTFFILPEYRAGGLGRRAMDLLESMATQEPHGSPACKYITLNTVSKQYYYEDTPIARHLQAIRTGFSNHDWYERRGYVAWKEEPRYPDTLPDGTDVMIMAVFMRKAVA